MGQQTLRGWVVLAGMLLAGCQNVPSTAIRQPLSALPSVPVAAAEGNGAIFQTGTTVPLFEDRRARRVGDTLTVNLVEKTSANRRSETSESRAAEADISVPPPVVLGKNLPFNLGTTSWAPDASMTHAFKDNDTNSNTITGTIAVTVIEVLPNGHLVVAGEKQVAVNNDTDYIRLAGVVNPANITAGNTVNSTQLANAQIESKNAQGLDQAQVTSMLARFFLTLLPF